MEKWFIMRKGAPFEEIARKFHISPVAARLIRNRDIVGEEEIEQYLHGTLADLHDGRLLRDMDRAVSILEEKIGEKKKIRVIGDYDIDGVNATYILIEGIEKLGGIVDSDIPDRKKDGYGLNMELIRRAGEAGVDTIVTCDNGIAAAEEIEYAKRLGMTVLVTDHHEVPYEEKDGQRTYLLPPADAVIDQKREDCAYPFPSLCGAAVAYKLVEALYRAMGRSPEEVQYLIENVALATVGDVMDLVGENRIFVKYGLEMLRRTGNYGLAALMDCTKLDREKLSAYHIGFVIGPCLNAGGRLDTAKRALALLRASSKEEADVLAGELVALNDSRKELTVKGVEEAVRQVEETALGDDKVLVIYLPDCHESLAGIVAGRVREKYCKPVFVLTKAEQGAKGSGRSIEAYDMYAELTKCKELFTKFGGHKMAAGLSLAEENVEILRKRLNEETTLAEEDFCEKISIDMQMPLRCVSEELVEELALLEPFGKGNRRPLFAEKELLVLESRIVGANRNVLKLKVRDREGTQMDAVRFGDAEACLAHIQENRGFLTAGYYPEINSYMGRKSVQLVIQNYQ